MPQQQSPWLEAKYGWNFGESNWNTGVDENLLKFSFLFDRNVDGIVSTLPAAVNGKAYFLTTDKRLYFTVNTTYFSCPTPKWFEFVVRGTGVTYQFDGTTAVQVDSPLGVDSRLDAVELSVASLGTASTKNTEFFASTARVDVVEAKAQSTSDNAIQVIGEYTNGLILRNRNQGFRYLEDIYLPTVSTVLPYTTTGIGAGEIATFRSVGDAVLRQDLANATDQYKGAALVGFRQPAAGAVPRTVLDKASDSISVKDFGARGDGLADDSTAIQSAINYLKLVGGGVIEVPSGNYKITQPLIISGNFGFKGIEVRGHRATINCVSNGIAFIVKPAGSSLADAAPEYRQSTLIHGLVVQGPGRQFTSSVGVQVEQGANVQVRDCTIQGFYRGLHGYGALICNFHNLLIQNNNYGIDFIRMPPGSGGFAPEFGPNDVHFYVCQVIANIHAVRVLDFPNGAVSFTGCEIEGNNLQGTPSDGVRVVEFFNAGKVAFYSCHLEENPGEYNIFFHGQNKDCALSIIGSEIIPGNSCGNCLYLSNASGEENAASAFISGTRITNGVGNQVFVAAGFSLTAVGELVGLISGSLERVTYIRGGRVISGGNESPFAQSRFNGPASTGIAAEFQGITRTVNAAGDRMAYSGHNEVSAYSLSDLGGYVIGANAGGRVHVSRLGGKTFEPVEDNTYSLGSASLRWGTIFAGNGTISTSDEREKCQQRSQSEKEKSAALELKSKLCAFKWKDSVGSKGDSARWHFGVMAQEVERVFLMHGLSADDYGIFCKDNLDGDSSRYGVRYDQLLAFVVAAL